MLSVIQNERRQKIGISLLNSFIKNITSNSMFFIPIEIIFLINEFKSEIHLLKILFLYL